MRALFAVLAIVVIAGSSAAIGSSTTAPSSAEPAKSRVIDRTVSCKVPLTGGIHEATVSANTGTRLAGKHSVWKYLASVGGGANDGGGAGVQAGNPAAPLAPGVPYGSVRLSVDAPPVCTAHRRIPLSKAGLVALPVPALAPQDGLAQCYPVARVLVRVRGIFTAPTSLRLERDRSGAHLAASGTVATGYLAIRSATGKSLAYGEVFQNGKAKLFVARSCDR